MCVSGFYAKSIFNLAAEHLCKYQILTTNTDPWTGSCFGFDLGLRSENTANTDMRCCLYIKWQLYGNLFAASTCVCFSYTFVYAIAHLPVMIIKIISGGQLNNFWLLMCLQERQIMNLTLSLIHLGISDCFIICASGYVAIRWAKNKVINLVQSGFLVKNCLWNVKITGPCNLPAKSFLLLLTGSCGALSLSFNFLLNFHKKLWKLLSTNINKM